MHRTVEVAIRYHDRQRQSERTRERTRSEPSLSRRPSALEAERQVTARFREHTSELRRQINDPARRDLAASIRLVAAGYDPATIERAVRNASPDLEERTRGQIDRYVRATVKVAMEAHARRLERDLGRDRDDGMER